MAETLEQVLRRLEGDYQSAGRNNPTDLANLRNQVRKFFGENTQVVPNSATSPPATSTATPKPTDDDEGGGGSGGRGPSPGEFGNLTGEERSTLGGIARAAGLIGAVAPGFGTFGQMMSGILGIDSLMSALGIMSRGYVGPTEVDFQSVRDMQGPAAAAAARAQANMDMTSATIGRDAQQQAEAASRSDWNTTAETADREGGAALGGGGGPGGTGGPGGPGSGDRSSDGEGGVSMARGGVRVVNKPTNVKVGDAGTEAIVGIPGHKLNPEIMQTLALLLQQIRGDK